MKILQINSDYAYGSTGKIVECLHNALITEEIDSYVCYGRSNGKKTSRIKPVISTFHSKVYHLYAAISGNKYGGCFLSTYRIISLIKKLNPDLIHLQCINGYFVNIPKLMTWIAKHNYKTILTIHAEFMYTGGCDHAYDCEQWKYGCHKCNISRKFRSMTVPNRSELIFNNLNKAFRYFSNTQLVIVSVSNWMRSRAEQSPMLDRFSHRVIFNPVDTDVFIRRTGIIEYKKKIVGLDKMLFFPTAEFNPLDEKDNKGGKYVIELAKRVKRENMPIKIVVAANFANQIDLPDNVIYIGCVKNQEEMSKLYSMADITILLSRRESFGMTVAESLCCGTPVVGFEAGGPESIAIKEYTRFIKYGEINILYETILGVLNCPVLNTNSSREEISLKARNKYSQKEIISQYLNLYKGVL